MLNEGPKIQAKYHLTESFRPDMNIPAFQYAARLAGNATGPNPQTSQPRPQSTTPASAQASNVPREVAQRAPEAQPVLNLSDTTLTRRDVPRGSFVDIIA
jgi:hypothetical protein